MWSNLNLRTRVLSVVAALTCLCLAGGAFSFWFALKMNHFVTRAVDRDLAVMKTTEQLDTALVMQKGYLTYFFQDGDQTWLRELADREKEFSRLLALNKSLTSRADDLKTLGRIESSYQGLTALRDRIIDLYQAGQRREGYRLHLQARHLFFQIRDLTGSFKSATWARIGKARRDLVSNADWLSRLSLTGMVIAVVLGLALTLVLIRQILRPISRLVREAGAADPPVSSQGNEVQALQNGVHSLIENVDEAQLQLKVSREHLIEAAKLASVGKLAAGVAHSIRNPLTSVKMRLFSLERGLELKPSQQDDFDVIAEETRHIDNILRNFLEFSRRPKLRVEPVSPSDIVDLALTLLSHRLESYRVEVELDRPRRLPQTEVDTEQLKEVLVNLMVNSCEAMIPDSAEPGAVKTPPGGRVLISESEETRSDLGRVLVIRISDTGPGIPDDIRERIFEPFFTTKDEGTGLGLSIATRIVEEHGGRLELESRPGYAATFVVILPQAAGRDKRPTQAAGKEPSWKES